MSLDDGELSLWAKAWLLADGIAAIAVGLAVTEWLGYPNFYLALASGPLGFGPAMGSLKVLFITAAAAFVAIRLVPYFGSKIVLYCVALVLFVSGDPVPMAELEGKQGPDRYELIARYEEAYDRVRDKWRKDVRVAGAYGVPGTVPPMLEIEERGTDVLVRNVTDKWLCVRVSRVADRDGGRIARCPLETAAACADIGPQGVHEYKMSKWGTTQPCANGALEFRIGDPTDPEPSWWTTTALADYDETSKDIRSRRTQRPRFGQSENPTTAQFPTQHFVDQIYAFEQLLAEPDRRERWRRELEELQQRRAARRSAGSPASAAASNSSAGAAALEARYDDTPLGLDTELEAEYDATPLTPDR